MKRYEQIRSAATTAGIHEKNDCAVVAISIATGIEYAKVHAMLKQLGRKDRCGTRVSLTRAAVERFGFKMEKVDISRLPRSVKSIAPALGKGSYLVRTSGHILAVIDGVAEDWTSGRRHRPLDVFKIVGSACPACGQPKTPGHEHPVEEPTPEEIEEPTPAPAPTPKKQSTRMLKVCCQECGYTARVSGKWLTEKGAPICPCNHQPMEEA